MNNLGGPSNAAIATCVALMVLGALSGIVGAAYGLEWLLAHFGSVP